MGQWRESQYDAAPSALGENARAVVIEGVRVLDISNPSAPRFIGHFLSPRFAAPGREDRHTREVWQDPDTNLIYVTDGNGGGITVVRYTGPIPPGRPIPGAR
jgi:hypothetical protein